VEVDTAPLCVTLWTDDPDLAARADRAGVDRVGVDLERRGKAARQAGYGTWLSDHREDALDAIAGRLRSARLFARCDPPHAGTAAQVERLLAAGVEVLMLPMYRTDDDVRRFVDAVGGRAMVVLLLETAEAARTVHTTVAVPGVDEIHVGLNDLALALGLRSRFAVLASPLLDELAATVVARMPLGVGGVARASDRTLPVPPDLVYARLAQLGASRTLLSRAFVAPDADLAAGVAEARERHASWRERRGEDQALALADLRRHSAALTEW
jgi:hypothetical protein